MIYLLWDRTKNSLLILWQQFRVSYGENLPHEQSEAYWYMSQQEQIAEEANAKDNLKDDNNDGIADVKQIGKSAPLLLRP